MKRLFIFAAYDKDGFIDETLMMYLRSLSVLGDIIFVMDNNTSESELSKLKSVKNILHVDAAVHGEYDFGSYKRGFLWARENKLFSKYDWIYFVNDSVYGPFWDVEPILKDLESRGVDLTGMIDLESYRVPVQVQSWFVGVSKKLITQSFIYDFFQSVTHEDDKEVIVLKYEDGLTRCCIQNGFKMSTFISGEHCDICHSMYSEPIDILKRGIPFIKKMSELPGIRYLYPYTDTKTVDAIYNNAIRTHKLPVMNYNKVPYKKTFRLTLFALPILTIWCQNQKGVSVKSYKITLFDKICIFKIMNRRV